MQCPGPTSGRTSPFPSVARWYTPAPLGPRISRDLSSRAEGSDRPPLDLATRIRFALRQVAGVGLAHLARQLAAEEPRRSADDRQSAGSHARGSQSLVPGISERLRELLRRALAL